MAAEREGPLHWPSLQPEESRDEWAALRAWVDHLTRRFPLSARVIPPCWFRHEHLVEVLAALRDYERACFQHRASPASAFDFIRTLREAEHLLTDWTSRTGCTAGDHHETTVRDVTVDDDDWQSIVEADWVYRRVIADRVDQVLDYK